MKDEFDLQVSQPKELVKGTTVNFCFLVFWLVTYFFLIKKIELKDSCDDFKKMSTEEGQVDHLLSTPSSYRAGMHSTVRK